MNKPKANSKRITKKQSRPRRTATSQESLISAPMRTPTMQYVGRDASTPGVAFLRTSTTLLVGQQVFNIVFTDFATWFPYANSLLSSYRYFRVRNARVQVLPTGGAASLTSSAFNITNDDYNDGTAVNILNDDYAAIANAITRPVLQPPRRYWDMGNRTWYMSVNPAAGLPVLEDLSAGTINIDTTSGVLVAGTPVGYITVEMEFEFHTLK